MDDLEEKLKEERQKTITTQEELNKKINEVREREELGINVHLHSPYLYQLSKAVKSEEAVMARLGSLDQERMKLLDEQVSLERKAKELSKVCKQTPTQ